MTAKNTSATNVLRTHGFRVTSGRMKLLAMLEKAAKPLSIQAIRKLWRGRKSDQATLYRTLNDLALAGIVKRIDMNTGTAHFEYTPDHPHHHHLICTGCGTIEDVEGCEIPNIEKTVARHSKNFGEIYSHTLEFFGRCLRCPQT